MTNSGKSFRIRYIGLLSVVVFACTLLSFLLSQYKLLNVQHAWEGSFESHVKAEISGEWKLADQRIIVIAPAVGSLVASQKNVEPYGPESIQVLLQSLANALYSSDVSLDVLLAPESDGSAFDERYTAVRATDWNHGEMRVVNLTTPGLFEVILGAWTPLENSREQVVIIDSAFARNVNVNWFERLRAVRSRYARVSDIAGFAALPAPKNLGSIVNDQEVYLYQAAAYIPILALSGAEEWRLFQRWLIARRSEWFLWPSVVRPRDKHDREWKGFTARGRAHWTMWYTRFLAEHGLYIMYPPTDDPRSLHDPNKKAYGGGLLTLSFSGKVVHRSTEVGRATEKELNEIMQMASRANGNVALTIVTDAFLETARSWICNTNVGGFRPPATLWITPEKGSYEVLRKVKGSHAIHMRNIRGGRKNSGTSFNTPGYWLLMLERTRLIRDLLERGVSVFLFEPDQVWLRDPMPVINRLVESGDGVDLVGTLDSLNQIAGNFLYLVPTVASRRLWREVARRFSKAYHSAGMHLRHMAQFRRYIENDQSILTHLVFYDTEFKRQNPVVFRPLDTDRFVDGRWYLKKSFYGKSAASPTMINNNFIIGIQKKKERLKKVGHWFWIDGKCDEVQVRQAIKVNQMREAAAIKAAKAISGSNTEPENDFDVGIEKVIEAISKSLKYI